MNGTALLAVLPFVFSATSAFAEATEEGAAHLVEVFQTYLGTAEGVVSVALDGGDYLVTLDGAPLATLAAAAGSTFNVTPLVMTLTDNEDGTWDVSQDQAVSVAFAIPGQMDMQEDIGSMAWEGVFDEELMSFSSAKGEMSDIKVKQNVTDPSSGEMLVEVTIASGNFEMTGAPGVGGGVDGTYSMVMNGFSEAVTTPPQGDMPGMPIVVTIESLAQTGKSSGLKMDGILGAVAWFVSHPTTEAKEADKAGLKTILHDGLPFFASTAGDMTAKKVLVATPMGDAGIDELVVNVEMNGVVADGKLREAFTFSGLTLPPGVVPDWAAAILPQKVSLDFQVTDFDAAAAAKVALGLFDLPAGAAPDEAFQANLLAALLPNKTVTIGLNPGAVTGDGYELTYEGSMAAGPDMPMPTGRAMITLAGIEKLQAALGAAPPESIHMMDAGQLAIPEVSFFVLWDGAAAIGMGAFKRMDVTHAEVKSMHVLSEYRGQGLSRLMLDHLMDEARAAGVSRLSLETGSQAMFEPARRLYAGAGFELCGPFAAYVLDPNSIYMTRALA